jgi:hypothetical protein
MWADWSDGTSTRAHRHRRRVPHTRRLHVQQARRASLIRCGLVRGRAVGTGVVCFSSCVVVRTDLGERGRIVACRELGGRVSVGECNTVAECHDRRVSDRRLADVPP